MNWPSSGYLPCTWSIGSLSVNVNLCCPGILQLKLENSAIFSLSKRCVSAEASSVDWFYNDFGCCFYSAQLVIVKGCVTCKYEIKLVIIKGCVTCKYEIKRERIPETCFCKRCMEKKESNSANQQTPPTRLHQYRHMIHRWIWLTM